MSDTVMSMVGNEEDVVRILSNSWVRNGIVQHTAFTLREGETYISVNRPAIASYASDVASFVRSHKNFLNSDNGVKCYQRAVLRVGKIRAISVIVDDKPLSVDVEVEPRDVFTKSHAGIFTRHDRKNLKAGGTITVGEEKNISVDMVLLKVRLALVRLSSLETCYI